MKRRLTNTTFFDGYTGSGKMKDESDTTVLLDYTQAGGWNLLPDFAPTDAAQAERKTLSRLADEVMKHQWSNSREAMTALQELMDALPREEMK
jgi:hypothetical protein